MKENKKSKKYAKAIIFSIGSILFIVSFGIICASIFANHDNMHLYVEDKGFIDTIKVVQLDEKNTMDINLESFDEIKISSDRGTHVNIKVEDNAKVNKLKASFNGRYKIEDRVLNIDYQQPLWDNTLNLKLFLKQDIADTDYVVFNDWGYKDNLNSLNESVNNFVDGFRNNNEYVINKRLSNKLDASDYEIVNCRKSNTYICFDDSYILINDKERYVVEDNGYDENVIEDYSDYISIDYDIEDDSLFVEDIGYYDTDFEVYPKYNIENDRIGYEFEVSSNKLTITNVDSYDEWEIPIVVVEDTYTFKGDDE